MFPHVRKRARRRSSGIQQRRSSRAAVSDAPVGDCLALRIGLERYRTISCVILADAPTGLPIAVEARDGLLLPVQGARRRLARSRECLRQSPLPRWLRRIGQAEPDGSAAASPRVLTSSFRRMADTWWVTVFSDTTRRLAIWVLRSPAASSGRTSSSRAVNPAGFARVCGRGPLGRRRAPRWRSRRATIAAAGRAASACS